MFREVRGQGDQDGGTDGRTDSAQESQPSLPASYNNMSLPRRENV